MTACAMSIKTYVFIIAVVAASGGAQLTSRLFPGLADTARSLTSTLFNNSIFQQAAGGSGNLLAQIVRTLTAVPAGLARSIGISSIPSIISDTNIVEFSNALPNLSIGSSNEDAQLSVDKIIIKYGYPLEKHTVYTEDGYILTMFRIPGNGSTVFLMHGLLSSADDFVIAGPDSGLAFLLAMEGYDVWMGNARGNKHSRHHAQYKPSDNSFWDFSWHEIGYYDLPAMIDYVLDTTRQDTLKYVGHSQGTTSFFVMGSERPEYNEKISLMIALSPVAFMSHVTSPFVRVLAPPSGVLYEVAKLAGLYEFLPDNTLIRNFKLMLCGIGHVSEIFCSNILFLIAGIGVKHLNVTNLPVIYGHIPSGAATKQLIHYGQGVITGKFRKFDYGPYENKLRYGSEEAPDYKLKNVAAPISLFYSDADWLSSPIDVDELYNKLDVQSIFTNCQPRDSIIWTLSTRKIIKNLFLIE